ncbi:hypothetical protein ACQ4PT_021033 [Festuca glaucescens]
MERAASSRDSAGDNEGYLLHRCVYASSRVPSVLSLPPGSVGPDLNAPATVEPLVVLTATFRSTLPPVLPRHTTQSLFSLVPRTWCSVRVICTRSGGMASCTVTLQLPGGGHRRVAENEVLVLRYYPRRQPCWDVVQDLGGYSVFVGRNNAVSMYAEGVLGLKGNCVYWIGGRGRDQGMVFDMATGRSTPCLPAAGGRTRCSSKHNLLVLFSVTW